MASNEQLQSIIRDYTQQHYEGPDAKDRPDLFLAGNTLKQHLLVEFKRPSVAVGRDAEAQANEYADTLTDRLGMSLQILIIGGEVDPKLQDEGRAPLLAENDGGGQAGARTADHRPPTADYGL